MLVYSTGFSHYYVWGIRPFYGKYSYEFALYPFKETGNKLILQNDHWNMRFKHQVYRL